jgi:hypothetical protein
VQAHRRANPLWQGRGAFRRTCQRRVALQWTSTFHKHMLQGTRISTEGRHACRFGVLVRGGTAASPTYTRTERAYPAGHAPSSFRRAGKARPVSRRNLKKIYTPTCHQKQAGIHRFIPMEIGHMHACYATKGRRLF